FALAFVTARHHQEAELLFGQREEVGRGLDGTGEGELTKGFLSGTFDIENVDELVQATVDSHLAMVIRAERPGAACFQGSRAVRTVGGRAKLHDRLRLDQWAGR